VCVFNTNNAPVFGSNETSTPFVGIIGATNRFSRDIRPVRASKDRTMDAPGPESATTTSPSTCKLAMPSSASNKYLQAAFRVRELGHHGKGVSRTYGPVCAIQGRKDVARGGNKEDTLRGPVLLRVVNGGGSERKADELFVPVNHADVRFMDGQRERTA
jgi:hypothetical protein